MGVTSLCASISHITENNRKILWHKQSTKQDNIEKTKGNFLTDETRFSRKNNIIPASHVTPGKCEYDSNDRYHFPVMGELWLGSTCTKISVVSDDQVCINLDFLKHWWRSFLANTLFRLIQSWKQERYLVYRMYNWSWDTYRHCIHERVTFWHVHTCWNTDPTKLRT